MIGTSRMWLLSTWNVELAWLKSWIFYFNLNLNSCIWPVATILDNAALREHLIHEGAHIDCLHWPESPAKLTLTSQGVQEPKIVQGKDLYKWAWGWRGKSFQVKRMHLTYDWWDIQFQLFWRILVIYTQSSSSPNHPNGYWLDEVRGFSVWS